MRLSKTIKDIEMDKSYIDGPTEILDGDIVHCTDEGVRLVEKCVCGECKVQTTYHIDFKKLTITKIGKLKYD